MNVSAIIVTRGNVDLEPIFESLPSDWEIVVWDNGPPSTVVPRYGLWGYDIDRPRPRVQIKGRLMDGRSDDLSVYGRYAAIEYASHDLIYVQDDDVIVSDPQAIVDAWLVARNHTTETKHLAANMPQEFRHDGYTDSCLVGFGACFHRDAPGKAFQRFFAGRTGALSEAQLGDVFARTCDVVFTTLTPRVLVDVPKVDREFASDPDRMWKQPEHYGERVRMLELARQVRDS